MKILGQDVSVLTVIHWCITLVLTIITSSHISNAGTIVADVATIATDVAQVATSKE